MPRASGDNILQMPMEIFDNDIIRLEMRNFRPRIQKTMLQRQVLKDKSKEKFSKNDVSDKWRKLAHR